MHRLDQAQYAVAYSLYRQCPAFFPLIGAVLLNEQAGAVYVDNATAPSQVYVEHCFGFAQLFGASLPDFEQELKTYLLQKRNFPVAKVRLYTPNVPSFLLGPESVSLRSERQRFTMPAGHVSTAFHRAAPGNIRFDFVDRNNASLIEERFGVIGRFWRSPEDFILKSRAVIAFDSEGPIAICYAAAIAEHRAEIDVLTLPDFRHAGLGKQVVWRFIQRCRDEGLLPLWDCFTNNAGSMALCRALGFEPNGEPYPFFTINK